MNKSRLPGFMLLWILCTAVFAQGQEVFAPNPSKFITRFGFTQLTGGVIIVKAVIDDRKDSLNFVLDTGSGGISLDSTTAAEIKLPTVPSNRTIRGIAGVRTVEFAYNHTLKFPGLSIDSLNFHINDYELLSGVYGLKIDGIIGYSFLSRYIVRINYDTQVIEVFTNGEYRMPKGGTILRPSISGLPVHNAYVGDNRASTPRFYLDTGAGLCLMLTEEFCRDSAILSSKRKRFETVTEGLGGKKLMDITVIKDFKIGNYKFKKVPVYVFDDEYNLTSYPYLAGLIGNDLLRRFNITLNYASRQIHLMPNSHFHEPFDYSYCGLGLFATGSDIVVSDVIPNSPAERAGLQVGDVIVAMNNNLSATMSNFRALLQQSGSKVKIIYRRDGKLAETKLSIVSII